MQYQPSPPAATDIASVHPATSTEVVCHRELRDFESLASFRGSPKDLRFSDGVIPLQMAFHFGTFGSFISYGFSVGITDFEVRRAKSSTTAYLTPDLGSQRTSIFFRTYCRSHIGMIQAKTAPGGIPTHDV